MRWQPSADRVDSTVAWAALAATVASYDLWAAVRGHETLSSGFWRATRGKRGRLLVLACWAYLSGHLWHVIPDRYDPLRRLDGLVKRVTA